MVQRQLNNPNPYEQLFRRQPAPLKRCLNAIKCGQSAAHGAYIDLTAPVNWLDDQGRGRSFLFHLNAWDPLDDFFIAYDEKTPYPLLHIILRITEDWCKNFGSLIISDKLTAAGVKENLIWYDMAAAMRIYRLAYLFELLQNSDMQSILGPKRSELLDLYSKSLSLHSEYLADETIFKPTNHGMYVAFGQMAAGRRLERLGVPGAREMYALGSTRFNRLIDVQFTSEGIHKEHSPAYHVAMCRLLEQVLQNSLLDDEALKKLLDCIINVTRWFLTPDRTLVNFGDTDADNKITYFKDSEILEEGMISRTFMESGYWVVRHSSEQGEGYLCLSNAFHSRTHKHADDASFVWYEHGKQILLDPGRYNYGGRMDQASPLWLDGYYYSAPYRLYVERSRAHNTIEVNDRNHPRRKLKPYGSGIISTGEIDLPEIDNLSDTKSKANKLFFCKCSALSLNKAVEVPGLRSNGPIRHFRIVAYLPGLWLLCIDILRQTESFSAKQWFNFDPRFQLEAMNGASALLSANDSNDRIQIASLLDPLKITEIGRGLKYDSRDIYPGLLGWHSPAGNEIEPNLSMCFGSPNDYGTWKFATLISLLPFTIDKEYQRIDELGRKARFRWNIDNVNYTLSYAAEDLKHDFDLICERKPSPKHEN